MYVYNMYLYKIYIDILYKMSEVCIVHTCNKLKNSWQKLDFFSCISVDINKKIYTFILFPNLMSLPPQIGCLEPSNRCQSLCTLLPKRFISTFKDIIALNEFFEFRSIQTPIKKNIVMIFSGIGQLNVWTRVPLVVCALELYPGSLVRPVYIHS